NCLLFLSVDVDYVKSVVKTQSLTPSEFYKGYSSEWSAIEQQLDVHREMADTILVNHFLPDEYDQSREVNWVLIKGHAGAGKSILMSHVAWDAAKEYDCL